MAQVSTHTAKKIGLFTSISLLIGSMVGVGIFFKNGNVFSANGYNAIGVIIAWLIASVISICSAFCFAEVGSSKQSHSGLGGWFEVMLGPKFGTFIKIIQPIFYFGIISFSISIFTGEAVFNMWSGASDVHFSIIMFVGLAIYLVFIIFNYLAFNASARFQTVATALKFIPLTMVILAGIIYSGIQKDAGLFDLLSHPDSHPISFIGILTSVPAILFAFDSFVSVGNLSLDMKNPKKNVPLSVIIGMLIVTSFYILVTISQILVASGNVYEVFNTILAHNQSANKALNIIVSVFIFVSIIGVLNAFSAVMLRSCQALADDNLLMCPHLIRNINHKFLKNKYPLTDGFIISIMTILITFTILLIPSAIINSDAFVDGISNFPTTIFFGFYGLVILCTLINRKTQRVRVDKIKGFIPMAVIAIIGCFFVSGFQVFYTFFAQTIIHPNEILHWGLFSNPGNFVVRSWMGTVVMFIYILSAIIYYVVTIHVINKNKNKFHRFNHKQLGKEAYD